MSRSQTKSFKMKRWREKLSSICLFCVLASATLTKNQVFNEQHGSPKHLEITTLEDSSQSTSSDEDQSSTGSSGSFYFGSGHSSSMSDDDDYYEDVRGHMSKFPVHLVDPCTSKALNMLEQLMRENGLMGAVTKILEVFNLEDFPMCDNPVNFFNNYMLIVENLGCIVMKYLVNDTLSFTINDLTNVFVIRNMNSGTFSTVTIPGHSNINISFPQPNPTIVGSNVTAFFVTYSYLGPMLSDVDVTSFNFRTDQIISSVVGVSLIRDCSIKLKEMAIIITFIHYEPLKNYSTECVVWDLERKTWNGKDCHKGSGSNLNATICECNVLGQFAVLKDKFTLEEYARDQIVDDLNNETVTGNDIVQKLDVVLQTGDPVTSTETVLNTFNSILEDAEQLSGKNNYFLSKQMYVVDNIGFLLLSHSKNDIFNFDTNTIELEIRRSAFGDHNLGFTSNSSIGLSSVQLCQDSAAWVASNNSVAAVFVKYTTIGPSLSKLNPSLPQDAVTNSHVIGASLALHEKGFLREVNITVTLPHITPLANTSSSICVYWDYDKIQWDSFGCSSSNESNATVTVCQCNHLTNFAVLVNFGDSSYLANDAALNWITLIGSGISIVSLILCIICFVAMRSLHGILNVIHINLCVSLLIADVAIFASVIYEANRPVPYSADDIPCMVLALLLHYFYLATFMWMGIEGFHIYQTLIRVFSSTSSKTWFYLIGYGVPLITITVCVLVSYFEVGKVYDASDQSCWISYNGGYIWTFLAFVVAILLFNLVIAILTLKKTSSRINSSKLPSNTTNPKKFLWQVLILHPLLGLSWLLGLIQLDAIFMMPVPIFAYIFAVCTSLQGFFIFFFHCLRNVRVRKYLSKRIRHPKATSKTESTGSNFVCHSSLPNCETSLIDNHDNKVETPEQQQQQSKRSFAFKRFSWDLMSPKLNEHDVNEPKFFGISFKKL